MVVDIEVFAESLSAVEVKVKDLESGAWLVVSGDYGRLAWLEKQAVELLKKAVEDWEPLPEKEATKACHSTRHCVSWGFCFRCQPDVANRVALRWGKMGIRKHETGVYEEIVGEELAR